MKHRLHSLSLVAGAAALLALSACQTQESPAEMKTTETGYSKPQSQEPFLVSDGHKASEEEIARFLANQKLSPSIPSPITEASEPVNPAALSKSAALATCIVNFNQANALDALSGDGYNSYIANPYYNHNCNQNYYVFSWPLNSNQYRLIPEAADWCPVAPNKIGHSINGSCQQVNQAIYFPRIAGNVGSNTGITFYVRNQLNVLKTFNLQAIYASSGTLEVWGNRPGIGWWIWYPLASPGRWYWPAGTIVSELQVFSHGKNGYMTFDNLEIAINP